LGNFLLQLHWIVFSRPLVCVSTPSSIPWILRFFSWL
jgi:hypothetical protein